MFKLSSSLITVCWLRRGEANIQVWVETSLLVLGFVAAGKGNQPKPSENHRIFLISRKPLLLAVAKVLLFLNQ